MASTWMSNRPKHFVFNVLYCSSIVIVWKHKTKWNKRTVWNMFSFWVSKFVNYYAHDFQEYFNNCVEFEFLWFIVNLRLKVWHFSYWPKSILRNVTSAAHFIVFSRKRKMAWREISRKIDHEKNSRKIGKKYPNLASN